jgi:predicted heme/steroid binding protein
MKEFDEAELNRYNGENGRPIYVAHRHPYETP